MSTLPADNDRRGRETADPRGRKPSLVILIGEPRRIPSRSFRPCDRATWHPVVEGARADEFTESSYE